MSVHESILIALFVMTIVFITLIALSIFLNLQSRFINSLKKETVTDNLSPTEDRYSIELSTDKNNFLCVDEKTVAIIMASISHCSNTPLKSLKIQSIKPLDL